MAIHKRERNILKLMNDVCVETIPIKFVQRVYCFLSNGTKEIYSTKDWAHNIDDYEIIEDFIKAQSFEHRIVDIKIEMNLESIQKNINDEFETLMKNIRKNDD